MIPKELDDLIKEYLTDGIITDQERKVLLRKAETMGLDLEEIDLYITAQEQKCEKKETAEAEQRFGKKCPNCGRQVESMTVRCECGYEFRSNKKISSVQKLYEGLNHMTLSADEKRGVYEKSEMEKLIDRKKVELITTFPIPNTKEDIIEFLALAAPLSKKEGGIWGTKAGRMLVLCVIALVMYVIVGVLTSDWGGDATLVGPLGIIIIGGLTIPYSDNATFRHNEHIGVWKAKFDQALMKGRSMRGDAEFQRQLDYYESIVNKQNKTTYGHLQIIDRLLNS